MTHTTKHNPWFSIWVKPRATIRQIVNTNPKQSFFLLATLYGLQSLLYFANYLSLGNNYNFLAILIVCILLAPILGAILICLYSWFFLLGGKLLKGKASFIEMRAVFSWSVLPMVLNLILWILFMIFSFDHVFVKYDNGAPYIFLNLIMAIAGIWSLVLLIITNSEVQKFSIGRSIGAVVIGYVIGFIVFFIISFILLLLVGVQKGS